MMAVQRIALLLLICLKIFRLSFGLPPIVVFDPTIETHRNYYQRISSTNSDQHPSDSKNRIISSLSQVVPIQIQERSDDVEEANDYIDEYEALKLPVAFESEKNKSNQPGNKDRSNVFQRSWAVVSDPTENYDNLASRRMSIKNPHVSITTAKKYQHHAVTNRPAINTTIEQTFYLKPHNPIIMSQAVSETAQIYKTQQNHHSNSPINDKDANLRIEPHHHIQQNDYQANPRVSLVNPIRRGHINTKPWKISDNMNSRQVKNNNDKSGLKLNGKVIDSSDTTFEMINKKRPPQRNIRIYKQPIDNRPEDYRDQLNPAQSINYDKMIEINKNITLERQKTGEDNPPPVYESVRRQDNEENVEQLSGSETHEEKQQSEPEKHSQSHEMGGGAEKHEHHHEHEGHEDDENYESHHEHEDGEKGHHDKERHDKHYDEEEGKENRHSDDSHYHEEYESGEKKEKEAAFEEQGKFSKGHNTKGNHVIHKKDEYEKLVEFYDESHEEDGHEKDDEYQHEYKKAEGGHHKSAHENHDGEAANYGKKGEHKKGHHYKKKEGHDKRQGDDKHHHEEKKHGEKGGHEEGKKWAYSKKE